MAGKGGNRTRASSHAAGETAPEADAADAEAEAAPGSPDTSPDTAGKERWTSIEAMVDRLVAAREARNRPEGIWYFFSSGVFFMIVGALALLAAFLTMGSTHASFTFVLVVIGVAILLYGTGTQGAGNFENTAGEMRYKIGVAGGAGILAFAVGMGIVVRADDIRGAFQIERKYAQLVFRDQGDGIGSLSSYVSEITVDGVPVPTFRSGDYIVAFVPFPGSTHSRDLQVSANFYYVDPEETRNNLLASRISLREKVALDPFNVEIDDAGFDFPKLPTHILVKLAADEIKNDPDASQIAGIGSGAAPPPDLPAVIQFAQ